MFWRRILFIKVKDFKPHVPSRFFTREINYRYYSGISANFKDAFGSILSKNNGYFKLYQKTPCYFLLQPKCCSNGLLDGDVTEFQQKQHEKELTKINQLFPQPRVTLNELTAKTPQKIFEIHYRQRVTTPKGSRTKTKQKLQSNDWTCTYSFVWPEKIKFEGTALSKRQAAEKAALQALHYLHLNNRIDNKGHPVYDRDKIQELKATVIEPIRINISVKSMERVDRVWEDYQSSIKAIYERTFKEAAKKFVVPPPALNKDSTIDEDDGFSETDTKLLDNEVDDFLDQKVHVHPVFGKTITPPSEATIQRRDRLLQQKFERYDEELTPLPIDQYIDEISSTLESSRVGVIVGAAGCGKSTRAPAAVLRARRAAASVIVSEPRRVAARGLAERVAQELGEEVGETVGYQVRLQAKPPRPPAGGLLYCTSGVLLRRLQSNPGLEGCTHVFIDEAHERDVNTDITLLLLKRALNLNKQLKVIVMSATLDTQVFTKYFGSCPVIEVPGRTFPVKLSYLDDIQKEFNINLPNIVNNCSKGDGRPHVHCQEVAEVIKAVDRTQPEGAMLVFLPGWAEIKLTKQILEAQFPETTHMILPVHSRLSTTDQVKMFSKPLPGVRKIVLATNIAETSITIPDVVYVIDVGAHKENRIKEGTGTASLDTVWVSQAGAKQRAGRAGRVQPGHCYKLYTKEKELDLTPHTTPEILRVPLEQTVLDCKSYAPGDKVESFLSQLPEPPTSKAVQYAVNDLIDLGALTPSEQLTRVGHILASMPLAPRLARALLHSALAGNVLAAANVLTHCQDNQQLFIGAADRREEIREFKRRYSDTSDHAALHWIQDDFERNVGELGWRGVDQWCATHGLRKDRLGYVKSLSNLYIEQLLKCGILEPTVGPEELNQFSELDEITAAILLSGSNALLRTKRKVKTKGKLRTATELFTSTGERAHIGSESVNYNISKKRVNTLLAYSGGYHSTERRALIVHMASVVPPHTALLFAMGQVDKTDDGDDTSVMTLPRHKLEVHMISSQADRILKAREMLWNTFQYYIERDLKTLDYEENTTASRFKVRLMKSIGRILVEGHREYVQGKNIEELSMDE